MAKRLDRMREEIRVRHFRIRIEQSYVPWAKRFILFHGKRHPDEMGEAEVSALLTSLAVDGHVAASTQNQAKAAILFLYKVVLDRSLDWLDDLVQARRPERMPVVIPLPSVVARSTKLSGPIRS